MSWSPLLAGELLSLYRLSRPGPLKGLFTLRTGLLASSQLASLTWASYRSNLNGARIRLTALTRAWFFSTLDWKAAYDPQASFLVVSKEALPIWVRPINLRTSSSVKGLYFTFDFTTLHFREGKSPKRHRIPWLSLLPLTQFSKRKEKASRHSNFPNKKDGCGRATKLLKWVLSLWP